MYPMHFRPRAPRCNPSDTSPVPTPTRFRPCRKAPAPCCRQSCCTPARCDPFRTRILPRSSQRTCTKGCLRPTRTSGPGSALYGPNSANGVMHILTKSPFGSEGTTVTLGSGERSVLTGALRHAGSFDDRIGYKISGKSHRETCS